MKCVLLFLMLSVTSLLAAQEFSDSTRGVDTKYLEDQFYVGLTYNFILNKPEGVTQRNLSYGLMAGFIKDIPINLRRNVAIGIGLGYAVNSYYSNLRAIETASGFTYQYLDGSVSYKRNKIETHLIEMPLEFRWRNSTATDFKFWRLYAGLKLGYIVGSRSKFVTSSYKDSFFNTDTRNFRYGLMLNFGYNTFNIHAYYALNSLFEDGTFGPDSGQIEFKPLRIGLIFYIL